VLTREEVFRLVAAVPDPDPTYAALRTSDRYQALVMMGCWLGPRWNEAIGVRRCDLNPLRKEIVFGRVVVNQNGSHTFTEQLSKTDEARVVPVPQLVLGVLLEHIARFRPDAGPEDFLFVGHRGAHPLRSNFSRDILKPALDRAALGHRHITWLSLRHSAASLMFDAGLSLFDVQRRLGHRSPVMTAEVYTHLMRERYEEGRTLMERYIGGDVRRDTRTQPRGRPRRRKAVAPGRGRADRRPHRRRGAPVPCRHPRRVTRWE
jgi:integrase